MTMTPMPATAAGTFIPALSEREAKGQARLFAALADPTRLRGWGTGASSR